MNFVERRTAHRRFTPSAPYPITGGQAVVAVGADVTARLDVLLLGKHVGLRQCTRVP